MAERQFGPYKLVRQIAVGGMAEIHLAKTAGIAGFEKYVALKMIHPNFAEDEQFIQMLVDEAKIAVRTWRRIFDCSANSSTVSIARLRPSKSRSRA